MKPNRKFNPFLRATSLGLVTAVVFAFSSQVSSAATKTWANTGTDFNTTGNWTGGLPTTADNATFTGAKVTDPVLSASINVQGLTFSTAASSGYTLSASAGSLTLTSVGTNTTPGNAAAAAILSTNTTGTNTISAPIILGGAAATTATIAQILGGSLVISGNISSTNAITGISLPQYSNNSASSYTLSGNNTFAGTTSISFLTLNVNSVNALSTGNLVFTNNGHINNTSGAAITVPNGITGSSPFTFDGTAAANNLTFNGLTNVSSASRTISVTNAGGKLGLAGGVNWGAFQAQKSGNGVLALGGTGSGTGANVTIGTGSIYASVLRINAGIVEVGNAAVFSSGAVDLRAATLQSGTTLTGANKITTVLVNATGSPTIGGSNDIELGGGYILNNGANNQTLNITNTATTLISSAVSLTDHPSAIDSQTLTFNVAGTAGNTEISGVIQDKTAGSFAGSVGSIIKSGTGTLVLSGANTYSGSTAVQNGTLQLKAGTISSQALTLGNGTTSGRLQLGSAAGPLDQTLTTLTVSGTGTANAIVGGAASVSTFTLNNSTDVTLPVTLGGVGTNENNLALTKSGAGKLSLSGTNSFTGATLVSAGTLSLTSGSIASSGITVNGSSAKLLQLSSTSMASPVTLTQGTVDGTGQIGSVTVWHNTGGIVRNGTNAAGVQTTGTLTVDNLTYSGTGTLSLNIDDSFFPAIEATNFEVNAAGPVTVNVTKTNPVWATTDYPLVHYSGAFTGSLSQLVVGSVPGLSVRQSATITQDVPNQVLNLHVIGDVPIWTGTVNSDWTTTPIGGAQNWVLQTAGSPTEFLTGDAALFNDNADVGSNPSAFSVNIAGANVSPTSTTFDNSSNDYIVSSSGGFGISSGFLVKNGFNALSLNTANTYPGGTALNNGGLNVNTSSAIGTGALTIAANTILDNTSGSAKTLSTNNTQNWNGNFTFGGTNDLNLGTGAVAMSATRTITTNGSATLEVDGTISGATFNLTKAGPGTLALGGANTYTGTTTITEGGMILTGSINSANTAAVGKVIVGSTSSNARLTVTGGTIRANAASPGISIASAVGSSGFLRMSSGTISTSGEINMGSGGLGSFAHFSMTGGTLTSGSWMVLGNALDNAIFNQSAGSTTVSTNKITIGARNTGTGVYNLSGGTFTDNGGVYVGEDGIGYFHIGSGATATVGTNSVRIGQNATGSGELNLAGALTAGTIGKGAGTSGLLNFNGGTLTASAASTTFISGLTGAYIQAGGANLNDGGFAITIPQALLAPTGSGVSSIVVTDGGAGYVDSPVVTLSGGSGTGAAAVANVSGGVVTGFTIVNPGSGYAGGDVLTATLAGGGASVPATVGSISLAANTGGGLAKSGAGTTTLTGANTYSGATTVNAGTLVLTGSGSLGTSGVTVNGAGAKLIQASSAALTAAVTVTNGTFDGSGAAAGNVTVASSASNVLTNGNGGTSGMTVGSLTFNGAATLNLKPASTSAIIAATALSTGAGSITVNASKTSWAAGTYNLITYSGAIGGSGFSSFALGTVTGLTPRQTSSATLTNPSGAVALSVGAGTITWTGGVSGGAWTTSVLSSPKNWNLAATPTDYQALDDVLFDDTATGTTTVDITDAANVSPLGTTFSNSSLNYTLTTSASKGIAGTGFVTKNGTGTVTIANGGLNSYTGATTLNGGVFSVSNVANGGLASDLGASTNAASNLIFGGGTLRFIPAAAQSTDRAFTINSGSSGTFDVTDGTTGNLTISGAGAATTGSLVKTGAGKLTLSGQNLYTGGTTVNAGTLNLATGGGTGAIRGTLTINTGSTVTLTAGNALGFTSGSKIDTLNINGGTLTSTGGDQGWNINYYLTAGTMATTGGNYTLGILTGGSTSINSLASATSSVVSGNVYLRGDAGHLAATINAADGAAASDLLFSGTIGGDTGVGVNFTGSGKVVCSGTNTYKGTTNVNSGTLVISGNSAGAIGAVNVASGATLGGNGNIGATTGAGVTISSGGHHALAVGTTAGAQVTRVITGALTLTAGNILDLTAASTPAAGSYTLVTANGGISGTPTVINYNGITGSVAIVGNNLVLTVTAGGYSAWAALKGLDDSDAAHSSAKSADPDNDGHNNLYEFAFDGNPLSGVEDRKVVGKVATVGANQVLTLTVPVRTGATFSGSPELVSALIDAISYRIQGANDLATFTDVITEVTGGDATTIQAGMPALSTSDWSYRTFRVAGTVATVPRDFIRAKISE